MRFTTALLCAIMALSYAIKSVEAVCSWTEPYDPKLYSLTCDGNEGADEKVPSLPEDATGVRIEGYSGGLPEDLFKNRSLNIV
jgi:hypothetical protein